MFRETDIEIRLPVSTGRTVKVEITKELLAKGYEYMDDEGCTIFHALEAAGLPVKSVRGADWIDTKGQPHPLPLIAHTIVKCGGMRESESEANPTGFAGPFSFEVEIEADV